MPGNKYNGNFNSFPDRVERLVKGRELRKNSRASLLNESPDSSSSNNNHVVAKPFEHDLHIREDNNSGASYVERFIEAAAAARDPILGCERENGKPFRQRLLVVANRLPVSAVRKGEDSWSLEISAGGLVSALLGMW